MNKPCSILGLIYRHPRVPRQPFWEPLVYIMVIKRHNGGKVLWKHRKDPEKKQKQNVQTHTDNAIYISPD